MEKRPLFSIITVCFNSESTISNTLDSMLNQTCTDYEYIIIDGKSSDKTIDIIDSYKDKFGNKLTIISEHDNGIYDAMNKGIKYSTGQIIGFINANDWYENNALEIIKSAYSEDEMVVIYGMQREYKNNIEYICYLKKHEFLQTQMIGFPSTFISKKIYQKYGLYNEMYRSSGDYDFLLRLFTANDIKFVPIYKPISNFRLGGISGTNIANIETAKIRYHYGSISKTKMIKITLDQHMRILVKKILNKLGLRKCKKA